MAISLTHTFESQVSDGQDNTLVQPSDWNAEHDLTLAANTVLGRTAGAGDAEEIPCTAAGRALLAAADANTQLATLGVVVSNVLVNGGMDFFQQQVPATATARSDDTYGADCWNIVTQTASVNVEQVAGDTNS